MLPDMYLDAIIYVPFTDAAALELLNIYDNLTKIRKTRGLIFRTCVDAKAVLKTPFVCRRVDSYPWPAVLGTLRDWPDVEQQELINYLLSKVLE